MWLNETYALCPCKQWSSRCREMAQRTRWTAYVDEEGRARRVKQFICQLALDPFGPVHHTVRSPPGDENISSLSQLHTASVPTNCKQPYPEIVHQQKR